MEVRWNFREGLASEPVHLLLPLVDKLVDEEVRIVRPARNFYRPAHDCVARLEGLVVVGEGLTVMIVECLGVEPEPVFRLVEHLEEGPCLGKCTGESFVLNDPPVEEVFLWNLMLPSRLRSVLQGRFSSSGSVVAESRS